MRCDGLGGGAGAKRWRRSPWAVVMLALWGQTGFALAQDADGDSVPDVQDNCVLLANPTQADGDGDGWGNRCDPDFSNDGITNAIDLSILKQRFFSADPTADMNDDGVVNVIDLALFRELFFLPPGPAGFARWVAQTSGEWGDANNWFPAAVPPAVAHVSIAQPGALVVTVSAAAEPDATLRAASITSEEDLLVASGTLSVAGGVSSTADVTLPAGGRLSVAGDLLVEGLLGLQGGTLADARVLANSGDDAVAPAVTGSTLQGVTLVADLRVTSGIEVVVVGGLSLEGADVSLESSGSLTRLSFAGSQTLEGSGRVLFAGSAASDTANRVAPAQAGDALTIADGVMFETLTTGGQIGADAGSVGLQGGVVSDVAGRSVRLLGTTTIAGPVMALAGADLLLSGTWDNAAGNTISIAGGGNLDLAGDWHNAGTIAASGGAVTLDGPWSNEGSIVASGATLDLGGSFASTSLVGVTSDSLVRLVGLVDNVGGDIDVSALAAGLRLASGARVTGGSISGNTGLEVGPVAASVYLDGVTLNTDLTVQNNAVANIENSLTLNGVEVTLNAVSFISWLRFNGTQSLAGTGTVRFDGSPSNLSNNRILQGNDDELLTIAAGIDVATGTGGGTIGGFTGGEVQIDGSVTVDSNPVRIESAIVKGSVDAVGGADLDVVDTLNLGTIAMSGGGTLSFSGDWQNSGAVTVLGSQFDTFGTWSNDGSISLIGSTSDLSGIFGVPDLLNVSADAALSIRGNLELAGGALDTDVFPNGLIWLWGSKLIGGTVVGQRPLVFGPNLTLVTLDGMTLATDLDVLDGNEARIINGLTLDDADITLNAEDGYCRLRFTYAQTLGGTGAIRFAGSSDSDTANHVMRTYGRTLVVESGISLITESLGGRFGDSGLGRIEIHGDIVSNVPGRELIVNGADLYGDATASNGGHLTFGGQWSLAAGRSFDVSGGGHLTLLGDWHSLGDMTVDGGMFRVADSTSDAWSNSGTITLTNTPAELRGAFSTASLLDIVTDSLVTLLGSLDNTGYDLNLDAFPHGLAIENGARIRGGALVGSSPLIFDQSTSNVTLQDLTLGLDLELDSGSDLSASGSLTLDGAEIRIDALSAPVSLEFVASGRIDGNGAVRLRGTVGAPDFIRIFPSGGSLTIGAGITVVSEGIGGRIGSDDEWTILEGLVVNDSPGRTVELLGTPFTMGGDLEIGAESEVRFATNAQVIMASDADVEIDIGPTSNGSVEFAGNVSFNGNLNIELTGGVSPMPCDRYDVFSYPSFDGGFDGVTGPDFGGATFVLDLLPTLGQLVTPGSGC